MKKIFLVLLAFLPVSFLSAQTASKKTVDEICGCVKKIKANLSDDEKMNQAMTCMVGPMMKNLEQLKKEYKITTKDENQAAREVGNKVGAQLAKDCPEMTPYFLMMAEKQKPAGEANPDIDTDTLKLDAKVCENFKTGKYSTVQGYLNKKKVDDPDKSGYTEVKDGFVFDYHENKKYYTKWSIKWISSCEWEQTLVETTNPSMKTVMKKGDKIKVKAIGSTKGGNLWMQTNMLGMDVIMLVKKIK